MARRNALGLALTFHPTGRWMKRGKEFPKGYMYFGPGRSADDRDSYDAALAEYRRWQGEQKDEAFHRKALDYATKWATYGAGIVTTPAPATPANTYTRPLTGEVRRQWERRQTPVDAPQVQVTVGTILDEFDAYNEARNKQRHTNDQLRSEGHTVREKKGQCVSDERLGALRRQTDRMKKLFGSEPWNSSEATGRRFLEKWQAKAKLGVSGTVGLALHDEAMKAAHQFIEWAYNTHRLDGKPRNIKTLTMKFDVKKSTATSIPREDLLKLWNAANDDVRAWIALGLNCGFYAKDIAEVTGDKIGPVHLDFWRGKTMNTAEVNVKYKLWNVTRVMIQRSRTNTASNERLWTTRKGHPLVHTATANARSNADWRMGVSNERHHSAQIFHVRR